MLVSRPLCEFTGCEDVQPHYTRLLKHEVGSVTFYSKKLGKTLTVSLA